MNYIAKGSDVFTSKKGGKPLKVSTKMSFQLPIRSVGTSILDKGFLCVSAQSNCVEVATKKFFVLNAQCFEKGCWKNDSRCEEGRDYELHGEDKSLARSTTRWWGHHSHSPMLGSPCPFRVIERGIGPLVYVNIIFIYWCSSSAIFLNLLRQDNCLRRLILSSGWFKEPKGEASLMFSRILV